MGAILKENADSVCFRIQSYMIEASRNPAPILHMNANALVIEYTDSETGHKRVEKISDIRNNTS